MGDYNPFLLTGNGFDSDETSVDHTAEFDRLVQQLKRSYCDAYMTYVNYVVAGDEYVEYPRNTHGFPTEPTTITRPSEDGEGGGTCTSAQTVGKSSFVAKFVELRNQVDEVVKDYRYLPSGEAMQQAYNHNNVGHIPSTLIRKRTPRLYPIGSR